METVPRKKCLFLFTELAGYIVACMKHLAAEYPVEVHVVRWPVNAVAPFRFSLEGEHLFFYERKDFTDESLVEFAGKLNPDIILCSGWIDKGYKDVCRLFRGKISTVLGLDNPWRNTLRQNIASLVGSAWLNKYFSHCWVPGEPQKKYAQKLGFKPSQIKTGAYACDFEKFNRQYLEYRSAKLNHFPKKIIFVGRYTKLKGVTELWAAFTEFLKKRDDWELWCLGKGELKKDFPAHERIRDFGFVQPDEMNKFIAGSGVFILPSHYEHWGVVVHEFAASGFPLLCTTTTGAASAFLEDGKNGFSFEPLRVDSIINALNKITSLNTEQLIEMGDHSARLASHITPDTWSRTFMEFSEN